MIVNPTAGRRRRQRLQGIVDSVRQRGCDLTVRETSARGDAERMAKDVNHRQIDLLVAAGGDGTINEVVNGIGDKPLPLGIVPLGTANVLATEIGLSTSIPEIAGTLATGRPRPICLGEANGRRFVVMASVGLDAEVVANVKLGLKRYLGKGAYIIETMNQLIFSDPRVFDLRIDSAVYHASGVVIANGRRYGGRFIVALGADLCTPSFEVCRLTRPGRLAWITYMISILRGQLAARSDCEITSATVLEITGPSGAPLQADGDIVTTLPATIRILPDAISLIYPRNQPA